MGTLMATRLKQKRLEMKWSQKELAAGICEQAQISRIEKGNYTPGSDLLYQLAKRLQVPMEYFYDDSVAQAPTNLDRFKHLAKDLLEKRDYASLAYIYDTEAARQHQLPLDDQLYLDWIKSVLLASIDKNLDGAISLLETVVSRSTTTHLQYLTFLSSLWNFYFLAEKTEQFEELNAHLLELIGDYEIKTFEDLELVIKFRFNHAHHLWETKQFEEGIDQTLKAIALCDQYRSRVCLAALYCLLANLTYDYSGKEDAKAYYEYAYTLAKLANDDKMVIELKNYMNKNYE